MFVSAAAEKQSQNRRSLDHSFGSDTSGLEDIALRVSYQLPEGAISLSPAHLDEEALID